MLNGITFTKCFVGLTQADLSWSDDIISELLNSSFQPPRSLDAFSEFLFDHVAQDIQVIQDLNGINEDEVFLLIHGVLNGIAISFGDSQGGGREVSKSIKKDGSDALNITEKKFAPLSLTDRAILESHISQVYISPWVLSAANTCGCSSEGDHLAHLCAAWDRDFDSEQREGSVSSFTRALQERDAPSLLDDDHRESFLPRLWRLSQAFSFDEFVSALSLQKSISEAPAQDGSSKYPVLSTFIDFFASDPQQLYAMRFIPDVLQWFKLLRHNFSGLYSREEARSISLSSFLRQVETMSLGGEWQELFSRYASAWNASWANVRKFGEYPWNEVKISFHWTQLTLN